MFSFGFITLDQNPVSGEVEQPHLGAAQLSSEFQNFLAHLARTGVALEDPLAGPSG